MSALLYLLIYIYIYIYIHTHTHTHTIIVVLDFRIVLPTMLIKFLISTIYQKLFCYWLPIIKEIPYFTPFVVLNDYYISICWYHSANVMSQPLSCAYKFWLFVESFFIGISDPWIGSWILQLKTASPISLLSASSFFLFSSVFILIILIAFCCA